MTSPIFVFKKHFSQNLTSSLTSPSLYDLLFNIALLNNLLVNNFLNQHQAPYPQPIKDKCTALFLRTKRAQLRFITIHMTGVLHGNSFINEKLSELLKRMRTTLIYTTFSNTKFKELLPKPDSWIQHYTHELTLCEKTLKSYLGPIMPLLFNKTRFEYSGYGNALNNIAPYGFQGTEKDYYSVALLFQQHPHLPMFNDLQKKQWYAYYQELYDLGNLISVTSQSPDLSYISNINAHSINQPLSSFMTNPCSKNTYARFITVANMYVQANWFILFNQLNTLILNKNTNALVR